MKIRTDITQKIRKKDAMVGISDSIDSSTVIALCMQAISKKRVVDVMMPEDDSSPDKYNLVRKLLQKLNMDYLFKEITAVVFDFKSYQRRDNAIRNIFPEYNRHQILMVLNKHRRDFF